MVNSCAAYNCTERYRKGGVAFHRFPTSQDLREKWIKALRRSNFTPNQYSKLCAKHFTPDCYETAPWCFMKRLKDGAVPTIFEFSQKRKYHKKSLDDSSPRCQDRETSAVSQNFVHMPVSHSPSRRKQLIIERKDFNVSEADPSEIRSVKFLSKQNEVSEDFVETENFASLPSKRCRKKKTFSNDFVSEDWTSRRRGKASKSGKEDEEAKDMGVNIGKLGIVKSSELDVLETEKESAVQDASSASFAESNDSFAEICKSSELSSNDGRKSTNMECRVIEKIMLNPIIDGSDGVILETISCPMPVESKENQTGCHKVIIGNQEKNILVENSGSGVFFIGKSAGSDNEQSEMGSIDVEDINVSNFNESDAVSKLIVAANALQDISCSQELIPIIDAEVTRKLDNYNTDSKIVAVSSASTSNQHVSSVFKLNLEEEEAMLQRCMQLGEAAKRGKPVRLKKVISGCNREPVGSNRILKSSSSTEDELLKNSRRKAYFGDFKQEDLFSPERAAKCLKVAQRVIREKTIKIKTLRQRERRLLQKVEELENVIFHLVEKRMNPEEASTVLIVLKEND